MGGHWATLDGNRDSESRRDLAGHGSGPKAPASALLGRRPGDPPAARPCCGVSGLGPAGPAS